MIQELLERDICVVPNLFESCVLHDVGIGSRRFDGASARLLQLLWVPTLSAEAFQRSRHSAPFTADETKLIAEHISTTLNGRGWTPQSEPSASVASLITRVRERGAEGLKLLFANDPGTVSATLPEAAVFSSCHNPGCGVWAPSNSLVRVSEAPLCPQCFLCFLHGASLQQAAGSSYTSAWLQLEASMPDCVSRDTVKELCHKPELRRALSETVCTSMLALCPNFADHSAGPCLTALPLQQGCAVRCDPCGTLRCPHCMLPHHPEAPGKTQTVRCAVAAEAACTDARFDKIACQHVARDSLTMQKILSTYRQLTEAPTDDAGTDADPTGRHQDISAALAAVADDQKSAQADRLLPAESFVSCPRCGFGPLEVNDDAAVCGWRQSHGIAKPAAGCGRVVPRCEIRDVVALRDPAEQVMHSWCQRLQRQTDVLQLLGDGAQAAVTPKLVELEKPVSHEFGCSECDGKLLGHFYLSCVSCVHRVCASCVAKGKGQNHRSQRALHALHLVTADSRE